MLYDSLTRTKRSTRLLIGCGAFALAVPVHAQFTTPASPYVLWQQHHAPGMVQAGHTNIWDVGTYTPPTYTITENGADGTGTQTKEESGLDWFNAVTPVRENGSIVGYCAVGYSTFTNWIHDNGCPYNSDWGYPLPFYGVPGPVKPETHANMARGIVLCTAAMLDLDGNVVWYRTFNIGILNSVMQDENGDLVMTGTSPSWRPLVGDPQHDIRVNPYVGTGGVDLGADECVAHREKVCVMKLSMNGSIIWNNRYVPYDPGTTGFDDFLQFKGAGWAVASSTITGTQGYRVVGNHVFAAGDAFRPYIIDIDSDGNILSNVLYENFPVANYDAMHVGEARGLATFTHQGQELHAITGYRRVNTATPPDVAYGEAGAFVWVLNDQGTLFFKDSQMDATELGSDPALPDISNSVIFAEEAGEPTVVWPVLTDLTAQGTVPGSLFAGNHEAVGKVYKFDLAGSAEWSAPANLGAMRAFDLHFSAVQDRDRNIAVASTKWSPGLGFQAPDQYLDFSALDSQTQGYLTNPSGLGYAYNASNEVVPWAVFSDPQFHTHPFFYPYGYWFTDSYAAKLRLGDGSLAWQTQWDSYEGATELEFPGNFRQRQCNFEIVEAHDGGLIVVGNTGHNFDDAYIAKLGPCDLLADYNGPTLNTNNQYIVGVTETWNTDMRVKGSIVIQNGRELTIDGATIEFADTRMVGMVTNIEVRQGGRLIIKNGAHLTSLSGCTESMWDGIMAPRNPNIGNNTTPYIEIKDSRISNALVAIWLGSGDPLNPTPGTHGPRGYVIAERAQFENNRIGFLNHSYAAYQGQGLWTDFIDCDFTQNAPLNYPDQRLQFHAYLYRSANTRFFGCSFVNELAWNTYLDNPNWWGTGIRSFGSRVRVVDMDNGTQSQFRGLGMGIRVQPLPNTNPAVRVDHALFVDNARGVLLSTVPNARVIRNLFLVPDHDVSVFGGLGATYGTYLDGATGFELEENIYLGSSATSHPKVGAAFKGTGPDNNTYYNNRFDRFRDASVSSAGTIIQANNGNSSPNSGLHFKCNDYGNDHINDYDIAFTGSGVTIGPIQGANGPFNTSPAGNTFTPNSNAALERHLFVDQGINNFIYWHHDPSSTTQVVRPESYTSPPIQASWLLNSFQLYIDKENACPVDLSGMLLQGPEQAAQAASTELQVLEEVYADWRDGGDTEGLKDFILDPANNSYALRNELMLLAPKVSAENWALVFERNPAMTAWHLAQALVANSPLERATMELLENSNVDPYYVQLVKGYQNGGVSMHDLQKSDIAHFHGLKSTALDDLLAAALATGEEQDLSDAFTIIEAMDHETRSRHLVALLVAQGDATAARAIAADALVSDPGNGHWTVMDMLLAHMENGTDPADADAATVAYLEALATTEEPGYADAQAWLALLGQEFPEGLILPGGPKSRGHRLEERLLAPPTSWLQAAPNPSSGPLQLICTLPDGAERGDVSVTDAMGRVMFRRPVAHQGAILELDMRTWANGTYIATLMVDGINASRIKLQRMK